LARLLREFRRTRERAKQEMLQEKIEKQIEDKIYARFPTLDKQQQSPYQN